ncbi:MAG: hypothetical protein ABIR81_11230 [Ginsengibacter sp.]
MKYIYLVLISLMFGNILCSQTLSKANQALLKKKEDSLRVLSIQIIQGRNSSDRLLADSHFTRMFVRALKTPYSFNYKFDSLITISQVIPQDSTFRIFTWQMIVNDRVTRQHGAIQLKTVDGSLQLFALIDKSDVITNAKDTIGDNNGWLGALYYHIVQKESAGKKYYTLLGYDENNMNSNKKVIEVLTFVNNKPVFGGPFFTYPDSVRKDEGSRLVLEYKKNAGPRLVYDKDQDMIIYEHLVSESDEPSKKYTYIGDGDYEGFKWKSGKWVHVNKVYNQQLKDGEAPLPEPIRDDKGKILEERLKGNTIKNQ